MCVAAVQVHAGNSVHVSERFYFIVLSQEISRKFDDRDLNSRSAEKFKKKKRSSLEKVPVSGVGLNDLIPVRPRRCRLFVRASVILAVR